MLSSEPKYLFGPLDWSKIALKLTKEMGYFKYDFAKDLPLL
ncbi:hypothetical protein IX299_001884 [Porphyromonas levii]|nr:hypothetical protein [Porphyromonas levii]